MENELYSKNYNNKKSVISENSSTLWGFFFELDRRVCNHLYFYLIKTAIKTLVFFKKLILAFLNPKIVK